MLDWLEREMLAWGNGEVRSNGLASVFLILSLSGRAHITEQFIRIPVRVFSRANTSVGALRSIGLAHKGKIVVLGRFRTRLAFECGIIVKRGFG